MRARSRTTSACPRATCAWRHASLTARLAANYLVACALCAALTLVFPPTAAVPFTLLTGVWGGVCYLVSLLYYVAAAVRLGARGFLG